MLVEPTAARESAPVSYTHLDVYKRQELFDSPKLTEQQRTQLQNVTPDMDNVTAQSALQELSCYLHLYYGKKVFILLD